MNTNLQPQSPPLHEYVIERINVGVFSVNRDMAIVLWNRFMESHSGLRAEDVIGKNLFECFPELPRDMLERKINSVFILKNFAFTTWEQRPYIFKFAHNRPVTGGIDHMQQNCTFMPVKDAEGEVQHVCVSLLDVTDTSIYQNMLKKAMQSLAEASNRDGLTGIYNRRFLEETLAKEFSRVRRYGGYMSLVLLDLDHFKNVNDTHGHLAGDEVLRNAAQRVTAGLRQSDTAGRYGGEEFALILPETTSEGAAILAERLRARIADQPVQHENIAIPISISAGIAQWMPHMTRYENLIEAADVALYKAKDSGRNCVKVAQVQASNDGDARSQPTGT